MAGRNRIRAAGLNPRSNHRPIHRPVEEPRHVHPQRHLAPAEVHLMEDRIASQSREIQTLLLDNQRLANNHVALKQDLAAAQQEIRRLSATASSIKVERDAQVLEVYERSLKLEAEARSVDGLSVELEGVRADIKKLRDERNELLEKLKDIEGDIGRTRSELQQLPDLKAEIEEMQREVQRGKDAVEYERKLHLQNFELSEAMEKHMVFIVGEAEKLRSELANAEKRAMATAAAPVSAANSGPGYVMHQPNLAPGYGGNPLSNSYAVHQGTFGPGSNYVIRAGPPGPHDVQTQQAHN